VRAGGRSASSASSIPGSAPRRGKASIRSAGRSASCCVARTMPRTSACPAPNSTRRSLAAAYAAENWREVDRLVSDDVVRLHAACGTPAQVRARLEEYRAFGLDEVIIGGMDGRALDQRGLGGGPWRRGPWRQGMKFSISLPTCFEGVMYPIPFVEPGDFVRMAPAVRKARLRFGVGQRSHHQPALCARALSRQRAQLLRAFDRAVVLRRRDQPDPRRHCARRAADARSVLGSPSSRPPSTSFQAAGWSWRWASAPIARSSPPGHRGSRPRLSAAR